MRGDVEQALQLIKSDQPSSVDQALGLLQDTVYSFSMKVCGHPEDAEDTMQDVLLKSLPYLPKFENAQALSVWLYRVARNRCITNRRGQKFSPKVNLSLDALMPDGRELSELLDSPLPSPESELLKNESSDRLHKAVLKIPPQYRFVLVLHDMEGLSTAEVAKVTGLQEGTVRVRLHRARLMLRREMSNAGSTTVPKPQNGKPKPKRCRNLFAALSDYLDGVVDEAVCEEMQVHLSDCKPCEAFLANLESVVKRSRSLDVKCPPEKAAKMRQQLLKSYEKARQKLQKRAASRKNWLLRRYR